MVSFPHRRRGRARPRATSAATGLSSLALPRPMRPWPCPLPPQQPLEGIFSITCRSRWARSKGKGWSSMTLISSWPGLPRRGRMELGQASLMGGDGARQRSGRRWSSATRATQQMASLERDGLATQFLGDKSITMGYIYFFARMTLSLSPNQILGRSGISRLVHVPPRNQKQPKVSLDFY
jgi:hypothetical protein